MNIRGAALLSILSAFASAACRDEGITRTHVPKEAPGAARPAAPAMGSAPVIEAPAEKPRGIAWTLPSGWKELPGDGIRLATFAPPGGLKTEGTVVALPGDSGGELANVNRWRGQIALPPTDEAGMAAARTTLATKAGPAAVYDFTSEGAARTRLIAAVLNVNGTTWFFKLKGDAAATAAAREGFLTLIKELKPDAPR
jgi:hypothetical protein